MNKILDYLHVVKNIKKYMVLKKIENYSNKNSRSFWISFIDFITVAVIFLTIYSIYFTKDKYHFKIGIGIFLIGGILFYTVKIYGFILSSERIEIGITKLMMIDEQGNEKEKWELKGKKSLLIGKKIKNNEVDIDLSNAEYASLVSKQHAVLNFAAENWYIEDIGSCNGVGIKKISDSSKKKLEKDTPYKLDVGDIIYIANTPLMVE